jgi:hypothetical protein
MSLAEAGPLTSNSKPVVVLDRQTEHRTLVRLGAHPARLIEIIRVFGGPDRTRLYLGS